MKKNLIIIPFLMISIFLIGSCKKKKEEDKSYTVAVTQATAEGAKITVTIEKDANGNLTPSEFGVVYSKNSSPTISDSKVAFSSNGEKKVISGLDLSTTYYIRGFVTDKTGTHYNSETATQVQTFCFDVDSIYPRVVEIGDVVTVHGRGFGLVANNFIVFTQEVVTGAYKSITPNSCANTTATFTVPGTLSVGGTYNVGIGTTLSSPCGASSTYNDESATTSLLKFKVE